VAKTPAEFQSIHKSLLTKGAGLPVWGIAGKLAEVDALMSPTIQDRVFEFHPELAWARLAGHTLSSKHCAAGIIERLGILRGPVPKLEQLNEWDDSTVSGRAEIDDILDALVGLAVAGGIVESPRSACRLPVTEPPKDARGLRMEIWY
jgi:predicted RNase H-like nuclease